MCNHLQCCFETPKSIILRILFDDKRIFLNVEEAIIYSEYRDQELIIETIASVKKGSIPLIEYKKYTPMKDVVGYRKEEGASYTLEQENEIRNLLTWTGEIKHNLGFIRASVLTNNVVWNSLSF